MFLLSIINYQSPIVHELISIINKNSIELLVWDFDGVIFDLDWNYQGTPAELLLEIYQEINKIDDSIIRDKKEFVSRLFPYPEINEVGAKYGKEIQARVKSIYERKESAAVDRAVPNDEIIKFIKESKLAQAIWSNNLSSTIEYLLKKFEINEKIFPIASFDKVLRSKPDTEGFQIIINAYPKIDRKNMLVVGDSLISDKVGAQNAGINFYHYKKQ